MKLPFFLAKRFVAGEDFEQSVPKVQSLNEKGIKITLDLLGENVTDRSKANETVDSYIRLLEGINREKLISTISIKLTMMGLDIDRNFCRDNLFRLLEVARSFDQFVRIDMESSKHTQPTLDIFEEAYTEFGNHVGTVIQAMLHRSKDDIDALANMGADIRLVKGAYKEPAKIALQNMSDIREKFKEYAAVLLQKTTFPRFGTHDDELVDWVKNYAAENNIGKSRYEFQMLYGLREETMINLTEEGFCTRVYVPFGSDWLPYFSRRLTERKENIWFVLSTMFKN